ncbi:MAG: uroporphyrinogen-III synthase [Aigarchaeota archaeon]|nr:uroporphyrinogen-III synthase [Candidatus Pelearchaeum maunauluense]
MSERPLAGMRIVITRPKEGGDKLVAKIKELGGTPIELPAIEIAPPQSYENLDKALKRLNDYDWLVFTSANGVRFFFERANVVGVVSGVRARIAAVGPSTAEALDSHGLKASFIPSLYLTRRLAEELPEVAGKRVLLVRSENADNEMMEILSRRGALVDEVRAYRVLVRSESAEKLGDFDAVIFTSPSTARGFKEILESSKACKKSGFKVFCIGPVTARAAEELGFSVSGVAVEHTVDGLVKMLVEVAGG